MGSRLAPATLPGCCCQMCVVQAPPIAQTWPGAGIPTVSHLPKQARARTLWLLCQLQFCFTFLQATGGWQTIFQGIKSESWRNTTEGTLSLPGEVNLSALPEGIWISRLASHQSSSCVCWPLCFSPRTQSKAQLPCWVTPGSSRFKRAEWLLTFAQ